MLVIIIIPLGEVSKFHKNFESGYSIGNLFDKTKKLLSINADNNGQNNVIKIKKKKKNLYFSFSVTGKMFILRHSFKLLRRY